MRNDVTLVFKWKPIVTKSVVVSRLMKLLVTFPFYGLRKYFKKFKIFNNSAAKIMHHHVYRVKE